MDDYDVSLASSGQAALDILNNDHGFETVVLDIKMVKMDGFETANQIRQIIPDLPIIFYTGYPGDFEENKIEKEHQPYDYIMKQERPARLIRSVKNAVTLYRLKSHGKDLIKSARERYGLVGKSRAMQNIYRMIEQISPTENKVMILGPTGTGKELIARAIHKRSQRTDKRLAILDCNHKQSDLIESELFGHKRGAFTGAIEDRIGLCEYADGGTLFLDEIGDLDITTQAKLLRLLETGEMKKIGSAETKKVDIRLICATHRDLQQMICEKTFREDLYFRLKGITITLPALKERREDIPELIEYFTETYCMKKGDGIKLFEPAAKDLMIEYDWPGNVRQLMSTIHSLIDVSISSFISRDEVADILKVSFKKPNGKGSLNDRVNESKKTIIIQELAKHNNNISAAARALSVDPANLHRMIKNLGIDIV